MNALESRDNLDLGILSIEPKNVHDAVDRIARLKVLKELVDGFERETRRWIEDKAKKIESETGAAFRAPIAGVGSASLSDPQQTVTVVDAMALGDDEIDGRVREVVRYDVGTEGLRIFVELFDDEKIDEAANFLRKEILIEHKRYLPEKFTEEKLKNGVWQIIDGRVINVDTGAVVFGVVVNPPNKRTLSVRVEKSYLERISKLLSMQLNRGAKND